MTHTSSSPPREASRADGSAASVQPSGFEPWHRQAWQILNSTTAPVWLAMILFPRSKLTAMVVRRVDVLLATLGVTYLGLLAAGMARSNDGPPDLSDPAIDRRRARPARGLPGRVDALPRVRPARRPVGVGAVARRRANGAAPAAADLVVRPGRRRTPPGAARPLAALVPSDRAPVL